MTDLTPERRATVLHGDCLALMAEMPDASFDAIVTDPPYGLGFMGKAWDAMPPGTEWAAECLRVLKPGGHLLAFGGSRTWHRLACAVEDAGFEIRDSIAWINSQGFPKSADQRKGAGAAWEGWGTALKPSFEPVVVGRKPFVGTLAGNLLRHGVGALNIDGCRVSVTAGGPLRAHTGSGNAQSIFGIGGSAATGTTNRGRWPTNVAFDGPQSDALDAEAGPSVPAGNKTPVRRNVGGGYGGGYGTGVFGLHPAMQDAGNDKVSRFFPVFRYQPKAPQSERPKVDGIAHPTVKPLALMQWLIRLVTPPGGHILDPFAGSGATVEAALREGVRVTAIEREADYLPLILQRIERHEDAPDEPPTLFDDSAGRAEPSGSDLR